VIAFCLAAVALSWTDPSAHKVQFITVDEGVQLEVLDWGGSGRPVVLLDGYLTAHAFDDFAPKLARFYHVYGITRRGYGASSAPESGYSAQRSAEDVLKVLDALKLDVPILAGHSWGGQDLTTLGATHPHRMAALVYLNSAEDPTLVMSDYGVLPSTPPPPPPPQPEPDYSSFAAYRACQMKAHGVAFPEAELRQLYTANTDGSMGKYLPRASVRAAIFAGRRKPDYASIKAPVLAFFAAPSDPTDSINTAIGNRHRSDLRKGVPDAQIIEVPKANFYIFLSNQDEIIRDLRLFVEKLR
jgi:non-heme chloroperoxidase